MAADAAAADGDDAVTGDAAVAPFTSNLHQRSMTEGVTRPSVPL